MYSETTPTASVKGLLTAQKSLILDEGLVQDPWLIAVSFYDNKLRVIQQQSKNHLEGVDTLITHYGFIGNVINNRFSHTGPDGTFVIRERFEYDHNLRLKDGYLQLDNLAEVHQFSYTYNEIGELVEKNIHELQNGDYLQSIDYSYNIRGWLKSINNTYGQNDDHADLFTMDLHYEEGLSGLNADAQYNGNISAITWTNADEPELGKGYGFDYDKLSRLSKADYGEGVSGGNWQVNNKFSVSGLYYDLNGNIQNLQRQGNIDGPGGAGSMDDLKYYYEGNRIIGVNDVSGQPEGFNDNGAWFDPENPIATTEYLYDNNGNLLNDANKGIFRAIYNHMNLPIRILFENFVELHFLYDATGTKLKKYLYQDHHLYNSYDYCGNFVYKDDHLDHIITQEGRIKRIDELTFGYEYFIKDHLGSVRVCFTENTSTNSPETLQTNDYYPFGMSMATSEHDNQYKYNGKELYTDYGLDCYDYGARFYDPQIGRWHVIDPLAEKYSNLSPYNYVSNNPLLYFDYNGLEGKKYYKRAPHTTYLEKLFIYYNPGKANKIFKNSNTAHSKTEKYFGSYEKGVGHNDNADAFRHMLWQALNTQSVGKYKAKEFAYAHESETPKEKENEKKMDTHNNNIGIQIGIDNPDANIEDVIMEIFNAFESGTVLVIDPKTGNIVPAPKNPETVMPKPKPKTNEKKKDDDKENK